MKLLFLSCFLFLSQALIGQVSFIEHTPITIEPVSTFDTLLFSECSEEIMDKDITACDGCYSFVVERGTKNVLLHTRVKIPDALDKLLDEAIGVEFVIASHYEIQIIKGLLFTNEEVVRNCIATCIEYFRMNDLFE